MKVSNFQIGTVSWMLAQWGDVLTTYICSLRGIGHEANPLMAMLWEHWGFGSVVLLKILFSLFPLIFLLFKQKESDRQSLGKFILYASLIAWTAVIFNTLGLIFVR